MCAPPAVVVCVRGSPPLERGGQKVYARYVRQGERNTSVPEDVDVKRNCAAHHEAGHIVIAAAQELRLRPEGLMVDLRGEGLARYCQPDESDPSRERVIIAMFAGFYAEKRFREERSYPAPSKDNLWDWCEARKVLCRLSCAPPRNSALTGEEYSKHPKVAPIQCKLENRSEHLVEQNWLAIKALATALLDKEWERLKPLKSGCTWSNETTAKYVAGEEVVSILGRYGIDAVCDPDC